MLKDKISEKPKLSKKIKRYAKVGGVVGGIASKFAGEKYLGLSFDNNKHAKNLSLALGNIKGPIMKIAQLTATIPDILPPEYTKEFTELQSNAPSMGWLFVKRRMNGELGADWQKKFSQFNRIASRAASLGQVHKAKLKDGSTVACKLQYPDMLSAIKADLNQFNLLLSIYQSYNKAIKTDEIYKEVTDRLLEELDYDREKKSMIVFNEIFKQKKYVHIPKVYNKISTSRLITMEWLRGKNLLDFKNRTLKERNIIAKNMILSWYLPFYKFGIIHGDPHLGNYTVREDLSINLFDFGCMRFFDGKFISGVINLYNALKDNNADKAVYAYEQWGFTDITRRKLEVLNKWAQFVYAPLMQDKKQKIQENESGVYGANVASEVHKELRKIGGIRPPREFVFMDRAAVGLGSIFMHLKAELNWYRIFNELIDGFSIKDVDIRQQKTLKNAKLYL